MQSTFRIAIGIVLAGLAMSLGWGIRGDYGHEAGAMIPGALLGLSICLASGREDWWRRASIMGICGAIGWAFGGQMSYAQITGYTASSSLPDVLYGYMCLFAIGGLWAGIGAAILALSVTASASELERFARPLAILWLVWMVLTLTGATSQLSDRWPLNDTDWVGAVSALAVAGAWALVSPRDRGACGFIALLAGGWGAGYLVLTGLLDLHMTPPRSDNWAGCVGLFAALLGYLYGRRNRAALLLAGWGFLVGGLGFALSDFPHMLGRAQWGPIGQYEMLHGLDYWKWMEQSFGLIMGLGVGAAFLGPVASRLAPPVEDRDARGLRLAALILLLVVMMWSNLFKNVRNWMSNNQISQNVLGVSATVWLLAIGGVLSAAVLVAIFRHHRARLALSPAAAFGRGQLLFLVVTWVSVLGAFTQALPGMANRGVFLVHVSFWITGSLASLILVSLPPASTGRIEETRPASAVLWRLGRKFWMVLLPALIILFFLAYLTVRAHTDPLPGSHLRFSPTMTQN